jgi:hypothetical protein
MWLVDCACRGRRKLAENRKKLARNYSRLPCVNLRAQGNPFGSKLFSTIDDAAS